MPPASDASDPEDVPLLSRGIPKAEAERLVIRGFLGTVIAAIPGQRNP